MAINPTPIRSNSGLQGRSETKIEQNNVRLSSNGRFKVSSNSQPKRAHKELVTSN